jgi:hypothetical protein
LLWKYFFKNNGSATVTQHVGMALNLNRLIGSALPAEPLFLKKFPQQMLDALPANDA